MKQAKKIKIFLNLGQKVSLKSYSNLMYKVNLSEYNCNSKQKLMEKVVCSVICILALMIMVYTILLDMEIQVVKLQQK